VNSQIYFARATGYVDRILRGAKPAELAVQLPTKYVMVINLKTASAWAHGATVVAAARRRGDRVSAPGKLVRSSRWKSGPSKGQRSECCVTAGDSSREAYTASAWGVGLSHERSDIGSDETGRCGAHGALQGPRVFIRSKATCAAPLCVCEVLTPCRGLRPHHVHTDRIGTWDISRLAVRSCVSGAVRIGKARSRRR
jgi:hypothetical protein